MELGALLQLKNTLLQDLMIIDIGLSPHQYNEKKRQISLTSKYIRAFLKL